MILVEGWGGGVWFMDDLYKKELFKKEVKTTESFYLTQYWQFSEVEESIGGRGE